MSIYIGRIYLYKNTKRSIYILPACAAYDLNSELVIGANHQLGSHDDLWLRP